MRENAISGKKLVTLTKTQKNSNFLKKLLVDLSFISKLPIKKNSSTL